MSTKHTSEQLKEFRLLYQSKAPKLTYFASSYVDMATAEDLVHDVFIKIWVDLEKIDLSKNIDSYLLFAVKNSCLDHLRHQKVEQSYISQSLYRENLNQLLSYSEKELDEETQQLKLLYEEINRLPERCREIFILSYIEGLSNDEIADSLKLSKRTVESHLYKGLSRLKSNLNYEALVLVATLLLESKK